jgi:hypothetical protein
VGKSRLAANLAKALREEQWAAGFVDLDKGQGYKFHRQGTLLIIDYPEEHLKDVSELLQDLAKLEIPKDRLQRPLTRLRVLFLTRQSKNEWDPVVAISHAANLVDTVWVELPALHDLPAYTLYISAIGKLAQKLDTIGTPLDQDSFIQWLSFAPENSRPLFIMAAAIQNVLEPKYELVQ